MVGNGPSLTCSQKLKVTELKELLAKHDLPQTGKKDELVKRLAENNISPEGDVEELVCGHSCPRVC
jgi:SAP domain-containing ribonucleoprotein